MTERNSRRSRRRLLTEVALGGALVLALAMGVSLGLAIAATNNVRGLEIYERDNPALPTQILDRHGRLITQLFADEKREIVKIEELPQHLVHALLTREDRHFFEHRGFRIPDIMRAAWNLFLGRFSSGASTITQQVAGLTYADRTEISIKRKLVELWWAIQLERWLTKNEIIERYLNLVYFGEGTYGVEAAAQFYFKHSARDVSLAEAAMLVIQLNNPGGNSPISNPDRAEVLQREILSQMVELGFATREQADLSFQDYWDNYDFTRSSQSSAFLERIDQAPYFSEFIRQQLDELLLGSMDVYRDGLVVHTTLDLDYQRRATETLTKHLRRVNSTRQRSAAARLSVADDTFLPMIDLLSLSFDVQDLRVAGVRERRLGELDFVNELAPTLDVLAMTLGADELGFVARAAYQRREQAQRRSEVEGALITIDSHTGEILAMLGGSRFEATNQFNRATQAKVQPGSSFKPLYYSAAISSRTFTPASMIIDSPVVFFNDDGTEYVPVNYKGEWEGRVLLRTALARSMNVPSLKVLDAIGFDAAIERSSRMLGITDPLEIEATFPRKYPLGLGIIAISPLQMARAYATFPNEGRAVTPISIDYIEDRNGRIILEVKRNVRARQELEQEQLQIMDPAAAYIMTDLLQSTVAWGTLRYASSLVGGFDVPTAGKTGTTQNWSDAWTVGFTPAVTTAVWMGFDERGETLGLSLTGATATGPAWAEYMKAIEPTEALVFSRPSSGLIEVAVNSRSGQLPSGDADEEITTEIFLTGTEPKVRDSLATYEAARRQAVKDNIRTAILGFDLGPVLSVQDLLSPLDSTSTTNDSNAPRVNPLLD
jgi:penicillin-binding protein 1A